MFDPRVRAEAEIPVDPGHIIYIPALSVEIGPGILGSVIPRS